MLRALLDGPLTLLRPQNFQLYITIHFLEIWRDLITIIPRNDKVRNFKGSTIWALNGSGALKSSYTEPCIYQKSNRIWSLFDHYKKW